MSSPENSYIRNIDSNDIPPQEFREGLGFDAESVVLDFFNKNFEGLTVRTSTESEDSGRQQIVKGRQIDAVAYMNGESAMCMQITTTGDSNRQKEKIRQLQENPFVRLSEMNPKDTSIPKVLIGLDPKEVEAFLSDHDFSLHPKITEKILADTVTSLRFDLTKTQNKKEQDKIKTLLAFFESGSSQVH